MLNFLAQQEPGGFQQTIDKLARTPLSNIIVLVVICTVIRFGMAGYIQKTPKHKRYGAYAGARFFNEFLDAVIYAGVFVFLVIRPFALQTFVIPSESMIDTLLVNDFIVANKAIYRYTDPKVGDIVVFRPPWYACRPDQLGPNHEVNADFIKRLVGCPGDIVEIRNGSLYRNGTPINEPYIKAKAPMDFKLVKVDGVIQDPTSGLSDPAMQTHIWPLQIGELINAKGSPTTAEPFYVDDETTMNKLRDLPPAAVPPGFYLFMGDNRPGSFDGRAWGLVPKDEVIGRAEFIWLPVSRIRNLR